MNSIIHFIILLISLVLIFKKCAGNLNFCEEKLSKKSIFSYRIIGNQDVESPPSWMAKLISFNEHGQGILCGATVIDDYWLLTAAHCARQLKKKSYVTLRTVSKSASESIKIEEEMSFNVKEVYVHPEYNNQTADNDIALLKITSNLSTRGIKPVCLVKNDEKLLKANKNGVVIGYGLVLTQTPSGSPILENSPSLQKTSVPLIPDSECYKTWRILSLRSVDITKYQICAGSFMHGTAPGDSGGPLLVQKPNGEYIQIGITSFGADGLDGIVDQGKYPGVYTRVSKYIPWIENVIQFRQFSTNFSSSFNQIYHFSVAFFILLLNF